MTPPSVFTLMILTHLFMYFYYYAHCICIRSSTNHYSALSSEYFGDRLHCEKRALSLAVPEIKCARLNPIARDRRPIQHVMKARCGSCSFLGSMERDVAHPRPANRVLRKRPRVLCFVTRNVKTQNSGKPGGKQRIGDVADVK